MEEYILTDGQEFLTSRVMSESEARVANIRAFEATGGNIYWALRA